MESKVHVAIGTESYDGFTTLQWALKKWSAQKHQGLTIVIIHGGNRPKDYVYTPLGKFHVSAVCEEKLKALEKDEEATSHRILSHYIQYCAEVKVEAIKLEKTEQSLEKQMLELISIHRITKLVVSLAFMKSSLPKSRTVISGSFHLLRHKPDFCELFVICGGRLVSLRDDSKEDDRGNAAVKTKERNRSVKNWLGKMFMENAANNNPPSLSKVNGLELSQWEKCREEIEQFVDELMALHEEKGEVVEEVKNGMSMELDIPENMDAAEKIQILKWQIQSAEEAIWLNKSRAGAAKERIKKAQWAASVCNARADQLESFVDVEVTRNGELSKELDRRKQEVSELEHEVEEKRKKLDSILELQRELSGKLQLSSSAKARAEALLEKAVRGRADMVKEIEELRIQRDVLHRRIEFCKEKDAIGKADKSEDLSFSFREFCASEIIAATEDFSERLRLKSVCGCWTDVYKGRLNHTTVAFKLYDSENVRTSDDFATEVKLLQQLRHPNIVSMIGFCSELGCVVYEYMHNRSMHDVLFSAERSSKKTSKLTWHVRIRVAAQICSGLAFLHKAKPKPIVHGRLERSKILLDRHYVAKISGLRFLPSRDESEIGLDIQAFGKVLVQLLTGKKWEAAMGGATAVEDILECLDGEWPMDLAMELYGIAVRCLSKASAAEELIMAMPMKEISDVKRRADQLATNGEFPLLIPVVEAEESSSVPSAFLCPIYQDVMKNPHLAADGFSYEFEAIDEWLRTGHDRSPMTNLRLKHKLLTPNRVLKSLIEDRQNKRLRPAMNTTMLSDLSLEDWKCQDTM